jgi:hypothetical protein
MEYTKPVGARHVVPLLRIAILSQDLVRYTPAERTRQLKTLPHDPTLNPRQASLGLKKVER